MEDVFARGRGDAGIKATQRRVVSRRGCGGARRCKQQAAAGDGQRFTGTGARDRQTGRGGVVEVDGPRGGGAELDLRLANSDLKIADYNECVKSANAAVRKGGLKNPDNAQITLGMCLYNLRKYSDAKRAFNNAAKVPRSQRTSRQWIRVIDAEVERNRQIRLAEEAARKKRQELEAKRAAAARA